MFIQFLLDAPPASPGRLTDVIMDSSPPTHYALLFPRSLSLVSRRPFPFAADKHDRCATLMRSLKYGSETRKLHDSPRISQKPPFHAYPKIGAVNVRTTSMQARTRNSPIRI